MGMEDASFTILIVEDHPAVRKSASELVALIGHKVYAACDADEALELLELCSDIDAVLTDIEMPGSMNGLALALVIHHRWPDIVVIATSGRVEPAPWELPGGTAFIAKPYRLGQLVAQIDKLITQRAETHVKPSDFR